ncbi:MAG: hypoxanthine phosphoribosyltransferase [Gemmatimonadota bacterium]|nr:hypoxanthine phosphoribosyltransferase [Gemmatimonadota bacterium]MDE3004651.1 hypoxanthine phosphoribosyltransferase [Gemmatimonadota bacterium]MDE3014537.1 hypoxanthine phosphoribosyltransferase [Gemmatimonadota bacterium]
MTTDSAIQDVVFSEEAIHERVRELGREISSAYSAEDRLVVIGVLKGSFLFMADLVRVIEIPHGIDFLMASSYGDSMVSRGEVALLHDPKTDLEGRAVLLVEDIVDTGTTLSVLLPHLEERGASRVDVVALLHKRLTSGLVEPRWVGFDAPNSFLVGYGLDHAETFRHLPYIASL